MTTKLVAELAPEDLGRHVRVTFLGHRGTIVEGRLIAIRAECRTDTVWEDGHRGLLIGPPRDVELTVDGMHGHVPLSATVEVLT